MFKVSYSTSNINSFGGINLQIHLSGTPRFTKQSIKCNEQVMIKLLVQTGELSPEQKDYIFDYDNQFIPAEK
jgi:hypothetical protein